MTLEIQVLAWDKHKIIKLKPAHGIQILLSYHCAIHLVSMYAEEEFTLSRQNYTISILILILIGTFHKLLLFFVIHKLHFCNVF